MVKYPTLQQIVAVWETLSDLKQQNIIATPSLPEHTDQTYGTLISAAKPRKKAG
ncbi:MAG: hypothetical protein QM703_25425 [Gemmatales bacterium]